MHQPTNPAIMSSAAQRSAIGSHGGGTVLPPIGGIMNPPPFHHPPSSTLSAMLAPPPLGLSSTTSNADDHQRHLQFQPPGHNITAPPGPLPRSPQGQNPHLPSLSLHSNLNSVALGVQQENMTEAAPVPMQEKAQGKPPPPPLDSMRAYRACINCRSRKSKCDLEINQGRPPCRRCQREDRECILGESHRGGRRVRKKPKLDSEAEPASAPAQQCFQPSSDTSSQYSPRIDPSPAQQPFQPRYDGHHELGGPAYPWVHPNSTSASNIETVRNPRLSEHSVLTTPNEALYHQRASSNLSISKPVERQGLHDKIASTDLQNPSDALEILAQVADRAEEGDSSGDQNQGKPLPKRARRTSDRQESNIANMDGQFYYKPIQDGLLTPEDVSQLFSTYQEFFHPFFPIAPQESFDQSRLPWMSRLEPHLFSAILTVASKDNERIHHICYDHMQHLVSMILAGADANIEAVEALLLLSQWVSHRPQASVAVGRGEEDRVAWMYIGTALRLGYFLGIDRSSFKPDSREDPKLFNRKRLTWLACYMCDRQVSVRVGKGFWSRGPGPMTGLKGSDFPSLSLQSPEGDNWALQLQASLELIQIFSNVHDILYSSKGHGWKEMLEGRYAKYLDDFRTSIRNWNDVWGDFKCSPKLKASMLLTYDYLRLYVNAFAYQATISRALTNQRDNLHSSNRPMQLINATAPDARFIYESLDAAKSLLTTLNTLVEPETLRYMPSSYYLFIIYSAVFLYKARSTTTMTDEERTDVRRMINQSIDRLQKASVSPNHMGSRYARLLQLLWRKAPKQNGSSNHNTTQSRRPISISERLTTQPIQQKGPISVTNTSPISSYRQSPLHNYEHAQFQHPLNMQSQPPQSQSHINISPQHHPSYPPPSQVPNYQNPNGTSTFSWLDLGATWNFATQNNSVSNAGSGGEMDMDDEHGLWDTGMSPFDMGLLTDYSALEGDNPNLIF